MRKFVDFILFSSFLISVGAAATVVRSQALFDLKMGIKLPAFVFFSTLLTYNLTKIIPFILMRVHLREHAVHRDDWNQRYQKWLAVLTSTSLVGTFVFLPTLTLGGWIFITHLGVFSIFYSLPIKNKTFRNIPFIKVFLISHVWAGTAVLPLFAENISYSFVDFFVLFVENFCFLMAITLPFDIRDHNVDKDLVKTIPMVLGITKTKWVALSFLVFSLFLTHFYLDMDNLSTAVIGGITAVLIFQSSEKRSHYYYLALIDGLLIVRLIPVIWMV